MHAHELTRTSNSLFTAHCLVYSLKQYKKTIACGEIHIAMENTVNRTSIHRRIQRLASQIDEIINNEALPCLSKIIDINPNEN